MIVKIGGSYTRLPAHCAEAIPISMRQNNLERRKAFADGTFSVVFTNGIFHLYYKHHFVNCWMPNDSFKAHDIIYAAWNMHKIARGDYGL